MIDLPRRRLLQAGLTSGAAALLPSIARAAAIAPDRRSGTLEDLRHVVILMQENRAFDHYFGALPGVRGFGTVSRSLRRPCRAHRRARCGCNPARTAASG